MHIFYIYISFSWFHLICLPLVSVSCGFITAFFCRNLLVSLLCWMKLGTVLVLQYEFVYIHLCNFSLRPELLLIAVCFQSRLMKHSQPSCFSISDLTLGWERKSFRKQILLFLIMLERWVHVTGLSPDSDTSDISNV